MYRMNELPESYKKAYVHFIPKSSGIGLRPISLTSCFFKLFETMLKSRLQWLLDHEGKMPKTQSAFVKGKSCINNVTQLVLDVDLAFMEKKLVFAAFLEVKEAFDNIESKAMANKLIDLSCPGKLVFFALFLTRHRFIFSDVNPDCPSETLSDVTHGKVLSALLFASTVKNITEGISKTVRVSQFDDDLDRYAKTCVPDWGAKLLGRVIQTLSFNLFSSSLNCFDTL